MRVVRVALVVWCALALSACSQSRRAGEVDAGQTVVDAGTGAIDDAGSNALPDARADAHVAVDKSAMCASRFGSALSAAFGRLDGTVVAVVPPTNTTCALPNNDHLTIQVSMGGAVYRMVVNVLSSGTTDTRVSLTTAQHSLVGPAFAEGWHTDVSLDYALDFGLHSDTFEPLLMPELVSRVSDAIEIGAQISVYSTSGAGRPDSTHLVHRNSGGNDGAIVIGPTSSMPTYYLFHFPEQVF